MIPRVKVGRKGLVWYLKYGIKNGSDLRREDKDNAVALYGDINLLEKCENYCNKNKEWESNYEHITLSFSSDDIKHLSSLPREEYLAKLRSITEEYIKHRTSGYDIENEVVAYAEVHEPKIKYNEKGEERFTHIHIGISKLNVLDDTQIKTTFYNNSYISETFNTYICRKFGLELPKIDEKKREKRNEHLKQSQWSLIRKNIIEECKNIYSEEELINYLNNSGFKWEKRKNKYTVLPKGLRAINIGDLKNFPTIHNIIFKTKPKEEFIEEIRKQEDEKIQETLSSYYKKRIEMIDKRRSKKTKEKLKVIYETENVKTNENALENLTFQQKILYKYYGHLIENKLKGFFIDAKNENMVKIINKNRDINISDLGDKIVSNSKQTNLSEEVKLMLDIALAKGWKASAINVNGNDEFRAEATHQLLELIRKEKEQNKRLEEVRNIVKINAYERPLTKLQTEFREIKEEEIKDNSNKELTPLSIKANLRAETVLNYAISKYQLNANNYEITSDNKIKNLSNKQKPKNVIDFLQSEINITTKQAITECKELLSKQPLKIVNKKREELNIMPLKISICKDNNVNALTKWEVQEFNNYTELSSIMKQYPYSASIFSNNYRNSENVKEFGNVLIFDIDNDKYTKNLSIQQAKELLEQHNISAMILTTRSHNKDKKVSAKLQQKAGLKPFEEYHNAERFRIIIPTNKAINIQSKEEYREFQSITAKALKIDEYIDKSALNDRARLYYPAPATAIPIIIKSKIVLDIKEIEKQAKENIKYQREKEAEQDKKLSEVKEKIQELQIPTRSNYNSEVLTYADINKVMELDIKDLIKLHDKEVTEYQEGSYTMMKSDKGKYSVMASNVVHDFKNDITFNNLTYLERVHNTTNLNKICRELENRLGTSFIKVNYDLVNKTIKEALTKATNDKTLQEEIKSKLNVHFCKLEAEAIKIADQTISFTSLNIDKKTIVQTLTENRKKQESQKLQEEQKQEQSQHQSRGYHQR